MSDSAPDLNAAETQGYAALLRARHATEQLVIGFQFTLSNHEVTAVTPRETSPVASTILKVISHLFPVQQLQVIQYIIERAKKEEWVSNIVHSRKVGQGSLESIQEWPSCNPQQPSSIHTVTAKLAPAP
ncbi:MAG: hypothetical protein EB059_08020 [Alphaproteobacteria bacterium]|nr:hypothetical protein [Alphaproteobacteria bacterium]